MNTLYLFLATLLLGMSAYSYEHDTCKVYQDWHELILFEKSFNPKNILHFVIDSQTAKDCTFSKESKVTAYWYMGESEDLHCELPNKKEIKKGLWIDPKKVEILDPAMMRFYFSPLKSYLSSGLVEKETREEVSIKPYVHIRIDGACNFQAYTTVNNKKMFVDHLYVKSKAFSVEQVLFSFEDDLRLFLEQN